MKNGPLIIDRGDGCISRQYGSVIVIALPDPIAPRWAIFGTETCRPYKQICIAAYHQRDWADIIETDLLNGGKWYQHGRSFSRLPRSYE